MSGYNAITVTHRSRIHASLQSHTTHNKVIDTCACSRRCTDLMPRLCTHASVWAFYHIQPYSRGVR